MARVKDYRTSDTGAVGAYARAAAQIKPPRELGEAEMLNFNNIVDARATDTWTEYDIAIAADLAELIERRRIRQERLRAEGDTVDLPGGNMMKHPLISIIYMDTNQIMSYSKLLGLTAPQRGLNSKQSKSANDADRKARQVIKEASAHDLLASASDD